MLNGEISVQDHEKEIQWESDRYDKLWKDYKKLCKQYDTLLQQYNALLKIYRNKVKEGLEVRYCVTCGTKIAYINIDFCMDCLCLSDKAKKEKRWSCIYKIGLPIQRFFYANEKIEGFRNNKKWPRKDFPPVHPVEERVTE